ncbi:MAG: hypothetical protein ABR554_14250 [Pyrinomonadaceae bacterium]
MLKRNLAGSNLNRGARLLLPALFLLLLSTAASAQLSRIPDLGRMGGEMVDIKLNEITLESIDFRNQTARLNLALDVRTPLGVSLKDFDYRLRLFDRDLVEGNYGGTFKVGGRRGSRTDLPVTVNLRSIPGVVFDAFSNRGRVRYDFDAGFTLPLYVFEKRFDQSFSGEVPLRSVVDAASILRARRGVGGGSVGGSILDRLPVIW